jgi:two-component system sensor histidine kinase TctE
VTSISRTLVFWLAVPLTLLALAGALLHYFNNVAPQVISTDRRLKDAAATLAAHLPLVDRTPQRPGSPPARTFLLADGTISFALRDAHGALLAGDARLPVIAVDATTQAVYEIAEIGGRNLRVLADHVETDGGPITAIVATEINTNEPAARYGFLSTLLWDFVHLDLTLVLVWIGIQLGLRPVRKLRDEVAERSPQDLRPIVEAGVPRELTPLAATLNRLFATLRTSVESQKQFIANTAHQLRTPITGMLAQLELLAAEPAAAPIKQRLATLQEGVRQLSHASNQLLTLARADPAVNIAAKREVVSLDGLAREVIGKFLDRALQADIDLGAELQPASVVADASLLDDLLSNLVDNALKYTPRGGSVTVTTGEQAGAAVLAVVDTGPGIPAADRERVRQRFFRLPNSPGHGSGLGLAIVEEIAALYAGAIAIEAGADGRGTKVSVRFPAAATARSQETF